ncbi:hypothetical protein JHL18_03660 [Clostridium sp. YIM B02505]|uniref:DUF2892 domain-containing protein n=1 Tax=Clostridium yunnanense TaxID=2800325 RepID=A0ABS1EK47_9CLOT|nr:hypothetical protein [Clostridium yunnanense]MBK1809735.1 hypothetical protein [Clostridium yunnanense]
MTDREKIKKLSKTVARISSLIASATVLGLYGLDKYTFFIIVLIAISNNYEDVEKFFLLFNKKRE